MAEGLKIVTIGGGSSYTPELIEGFIKRKSQLPIRELWLVDIEAGKDKLNTVGEMAIRMVKAAGLDWDIHLTLDRRAALKGADYVSTQFRVGLLDARIKDERVPLSHGVLGQETNGAGGIFKAFRTIPVILDLIKDMRELCPNAWLVDFTNPAGIVTEAAIKHGGWAKTAGLCNLPINHRLAAAEALNLPVEELFVKFAGINHFHWHRVWDKQGNERTAELIDIYYGPTSDNQGAVVKNIFDADYNYEQIKDLGLLPCDYHRYYYMEDEMLAHAIEDFSGGQTRAEVVKETEARLFELYKDPTLDYKPKELEQRGGAHYSDAACELIASLHSDARTDMVVSTLNNGTITDLPYDSIIESSGIVTSHGFETYNWGAFPSPARGMLQLMKSMEEAVIKAALTGDYGAALQAFTLNPLVPSGKMAKTLLDELLIAHKDYLPQFTEAITKIEATQPETVKYVNELLYNK